MIIRPTGYRHRWMKNHNTLKHRGYDYMRYGLLSKVLPPPIYKTKNKYTRAVIDYIEYQMTWLLQYVDKLRYFKSV